MDLAGVSLSADKRVMASARLGRRLDATGARDVHVYLELVRQDPAERAAFLDVLTTHETYFFRESKHFDQMREVLRSLRGGEKVRAWSAAASNGAEAYSMAMLMADVLGEAPWEVLGTDISTRVLEEARNGVYPLERLEHMPPGYLKRFCRRGVGEFDGSFRVDAGLRARTRFMPANLLDLSAGLGHFHVIFLRNVLIYFEQRTKRKVIEGCLEHLADGGVLFVGHTESLHGLSDRLQQVAPTVYRRAA